MRRKTEAGKESGSSLSPVKSEHLFHRVHDFRKDTVGSTWKKEFWPPSTALFKA